jgi:hypothetical protein
MCDWEGCTTGTIGLPNPDQRSVAKTSGFLHPYIYRYAARGFPRERFLALEGEGITWMGRPSRQGIALFSARIEFWRSTGYDGTRNISFCGVRSDAFSWLGCNVRLTSRLYRR